MSKEAILTAKDLSKTFSNETVQQHVLKNLNLEIYKGDFTVIMGNSGSGKSTIAGIIAGMGIVPLSIFVGGAAAFTIGIAAYRKSLNLATI